MPSALPPPPSAALRSRRPKKPGRLNINLGSSTSFGSATSPSARSATNAGSTVANRKSSASKNASSYRRAQTLDPELLRTDNDGIGEEEEESAWVSFGSTGAAGSSTMASGEERDDSSEAGVAAGGERGGAMPRVTTTMDVSAAANNTSSASSPSFLTTTDQSFDVTPPIHRSFLTDAGRRSAGNGASSVNPFGVNTNSNIEESPPVTFTENAFAEAAFTLDGSEDVEVSRFDISIGPNTTSNDDALRDGAPEPAAATTTTTTTTTRPTTGTSSSSSRTTTSSSANHRPDWSDVATWMRAPIDAITDAVVTPVLPPRFDAASGPTGTTTSASSGAATAEASAGTTSPIPPPRQRGVGGASGSACTPTIRPPRPSGTRATAVAPGASPPIASSSQPANEGGVSSSSPSSGTGAAERRRSAARRASSQGANTSSVLSPRRLGLGRSASNASSSSSGTGTTTQDGATRSPVRNPSMNGSSSTPRSTPTRGRSSSRVRSSTSSNRGRSSSRTRGSAPTTPSSASRSRRGRSVNRGGTPGSVGRGRSASRTRASHRSSSRTPSSRMARGVPSSPSAQSTRSAGRGRNSGRQNRGRTRSVSRTRRAPPASPSANSTGGLSRRGYADSGNDGWNIDLDDVSITSEPAIRASRSGRSRNHCRNGSRALNASNLRSLDLEGGASSQFNRSRAGSGSVESSSVTGGSTNGATSSKKSKSFRREGGLIEKLFGDTVSSEAKRAYLPSRNQSQGLISSNHSVASGTSAAAQPEAVHTRTLLTASVYHNQATGLWIATINTNQKPGATNRRNAAKYLKAFSFHTEREARESAYANAPPKMVPFSESPNCFICRGKFAVFRRPSHCRNCGVCICTSCTATWSSKMVPETYNMKKESSVKVCKSCNFLVLAFRRALLDGQYDEAIALYNTGNINLRCPFGNIKNNEAMYPIHCAAEGGNLDLLRWLVDVHFCPISLVRTGNKKPDKEISNTPIVTSKGRSVLNIAMSKQNVEMMRYLVSEKNVSVYEIKDLNTSLKALEAVLTTYPSDNFSDFDLNGEDPINFDLADNLDILDVDGDEFDDDSILSDDDLRSMSGPANTSLPSSDQKDMDAMSTAAADACIICYDNSIDCVMTPCGHQVCCLKCSAELSNTCPVCNSQGQFIRIFKP